MSKKMGVISEQEMEALAEQAAKEWIEKEKKEVAYLKEGVKQTIEELHQFFSQEPYMDLDDYPSFEIETLFSYLLLFATENEVSFEDSENWFPNENAVFAYQDQKWLVFEMQGQGTHRSISLLDKHEEENELKISKIEDAISWLLHRIELVEYINSMIVQNGERIEMTESKQEEVRNHIISWVKEKGCSDELLKKDLNFFESQL